MSVWRDSGFLQVRGKQLEYACHGPPPNDAPTLVLLHEGLGCVALWRDVPATLAKLTGWGVFVYSRQGYGRSDPADLPLRLDYMTREAVDILPEVLEQIGFQQGAIFGHSDGATIAAIYAGVVQEKRLRGLVLVAPHFFTEPISLKAIRAARQAYDTGKLRQSLSLYHADVDSAFRGWNDAWLNPEFETWMVSDFLDNVHCPVLGIQDRSDPYGTLAQIDVISERCRSAVTPLILSGAGHAPHLTRADIVLPRITEFLQELPKV